MSVKTQALAERLSRVVRREPVSVPETATLGEGLAAMRAERETVLLVCSGDRLVGIFTERDYLMKVAGRVKPSEPIAAFMTRSPVTVRLDQTVGTAVEIMDSKGLRNLPVLDASGRPAAVVTVGGIIDYLADVFPAAVVNRPPQAVEANETDGA